MKQRIHLTLEPTGRDDIPVINRLRSLLKTALRAYGLRNVECWIEEAQVKAVVSKPFGLIDVGVPVPVDPDTDCTKFEPPF